MGEPVLGGVEEVVGEELLLREVALEVVEYMPERDPSRACARALVDLIARAVARRLRASL